MLTPHTVYVWRPVFILRGKYYLNQLLYILAPAKVRRQKSLEWVEGLSKVGVNPFEFQVTYKTWAGEFYSSRCKSLATHILVTPPTTLCTFAVLNLPSQRRSG